MKILTNEYLCNTPNFKKPAKGGPANFARLFFDYLKKDSAKHEWIGIILRDLDQKNKNLFIRKADDRQAGRFIYKFSFPFTLTEKILQAKKIGSPEEILKEPIAYLSKFIKKISPDIVFLNGFSIGNWIILQAAQQAKIPIVIQHAGIWTIELDAYKDLYSSAGLKMMKEMYKDSSRLASAEVFLNNFCLKYFQKNVFKKPQTNQELVKVIPLPINFEFFKKTSGNHSIFNFDKQVFNIGVIARWDRIKNHEAIASLAELISKKNLPWKIHSITRIPNSTKKAALKKKYRRYVDVIDHLNKDGVADFLRNSDLIIMPSKFETTGAVVLEAIACKKPAAISPFVGLVDDYLKYGAKEWIVDFNNPEKAIEQIDKIKNKPLPKKLTNNLIKKHEQKKVFQQYLALLKKLIKK
jgi:hypothetical protein